MRNVSSELGFALMVLDQKVAERTGKSIQQIEEADREAVLSRLPPDAQRGLSRLIADADVPRLAKALERSLSALRRERRARPHR